MIRVVEELKRSFADPKRAAKSAGLQYVADSSPGIRRVRKGKTFTYTDDAGRLIKDDKTLARIKALVIPPAWEKVWICPSANGHIQAIGYDAKGRKQYRYHAQWRSHRDLAKYMHIIDFAKSLPTIRAATRRDLRKPGLPREKVLAATVRVLEKTLVRVGNEQYTKTNGTYGLTTLQDRHATIKGGEVIFDFRGKHNVKRHVSFNDKRLAEVVRQCRDLPGDELFQYLDANGKVVDITNNDVNGYLKQISGKDFSAKDFRTWAGTLLAARALHAMESTTIERQIKKNIVAAVTTTAAHLGNTVAVCRKCYVHPAVFDTYLDGSLVKHLKRKITNQLAQGGECLSDEEQAVLRLLEYTLKQMKKVPIAA
ncbi:MAG TPA: hypothetical protein VGB55_02075 [Tepidisphaeraceae bacterium]|jgi:DNA topoisomerase-1